MKYRKAFQIKSPSKPKKYRHLLKPRNKRKNLTTKREIRNNEHFDKKYIPLLRNIGMLFDNILSSGSSEDYDSGKNKYKRTPINSDDDDVICTCVSKSESKDRNKSVQKTSSTAPAYEIQTEAVSSIITTTTPAYNTSDDHISSFRWNKNISILPTRNPVGLRRNNYRLRERSSPAPDRGDSGHFTGDHGDNEHYTIRRQKYSHAEYNEQDTNSYTRDDASSNGSGDRYRTHFKNAEIDRGTDKNVYSEEFLLPANETFENDTRHVYEHEGKTQFEIRRNETKSAVLLPQFTERLRGSKPEEKNSSLRTAETNEEDVELNYAGNKRFIVRDGAVASENQEISRTDKTVNQRNFPNSTFPGKLVMIFDGYSVARDVNGENKLTEKAIHIHS